MKPVYCPVCSSSGTRQFIEVREYVYYQCNGCEVIFIDPVVLDGMDKGEFLIKYENHYWQEELKAARQRSWGSGLARVAELFLYAKRPVKKFVDIGAGPGYLLDSLTYQLPSSQHIFYACELFPPAEDVCTPSPNYHKGSFLELDFHFDAGSCIEVIEHLTPKMMRGLMSDLASKSNENSIYIFNTGLIDFIIYEDMNYLDPYIRGHVIGWSIKALEHICNPLGFNILPIPGKSWAFLAEYKPNHNTIYPVNERIWYALQENIQTLRDGKTGELMYILGLETARAYV